MTRGRFMVLPALIAAIGVIYWILTYEEAGTVLFIGLAGAIGIMGWILIPTFRHVGPTAPVDEGWQEHRD